MRAVAYARVSSLLQRDRDTIASQLRVLPEFIERQGWVLVRPVTTYVDDGRTAKAGHLEARTGLSKLLQDAALGLFDVVVVVDVDRLTRSEDLAERGAILGALQRAGVKVASSTSGQVLDLSTSTGDLFTTLHAFFAAEWTRKHRERVTQGKITAIRRGRKPSGRHPYGLAYDKATGSWSLDPERAPIVREIFERVAGGESGRQVADDLHRRGAQRPRGAWGRSRVVRIVRSTAYKGEWIADKTHNLVVTVPPIVDEDLWNRAQAALALTGHRGLRRTKHDYLLEGLGVCGICGAPMGIRSRVWDARHNGRHVPAAYMCRSRRIFRLGGEKCPAAIVPVEDVDERAWAAIRAELNEPGLADEIAREISGRSDELVDWSGDIEGYRKHLARLERVEASVLERYRRGLVSDASLDLELGRLARERDAVKLQLSTAERAQFSALDAKRRLEDARAMLGELRAVLDEASFEARRSLVELLVPRGGVQFVGTTLKITLLVPRPVSSAPGLVDASGSRTPHQTHLRIRLVA